jgi:uncharacterized membrane protein YccF (DUF307 family)
MSTLLNLLWFVFGGWISALAWIVSGCLLAITIVGLPWTPAAFRLAGFTAWPFGREVITRADGQEVSFLLNVVWFVLAGWWLAVHHVILAALLAVTLIGIPFAIQHLKLAVISLAPVGKMVVEV